MTGQDLIARLRAAGYRLTAPRRKLVDVLLQAETPLTAEEIHHHARRAGAEADLSTIYRNLATFCEMGWLDAVPGANGERHYRVRHSPAPTFSVTCLDCGQATTLAAAPAGALGEAVRGAGFNAATLRVTLAAHCEHECPRKEK